MCLIITIFLTSCGSQSDVASMLSSDETPTEHAPNTGNEKLNNPLAHKASNPGVIQNKVKAVLPNAHKKNQRKQGFMGWLERSFSKGKVATRNINPAINGSSPLIVSLPSHSSPVINSKSMVTRVRSKKAKPNKHLFNFSIGKGNSGLFRGLKANILKTPHVKNCAEDANAFTLNQLQVVQGLKVLALSVVGFKTDPSLVPMTLNKSSISKKLANVSGSLDASIRKDTALDNTTFDLTFNDENPASSDDKAKAGEISLLEKQKEQSELAKNKKAQQEVTNAQKKLENDYKNTLKGAIVYSYDTREHQNSLVFPPRQTAAIAKLLNSTFLPAHSVLYVIHSPVFSTPSLKVLSSNQYRLTAYVNYLRLYLLKNTPSTVYLQDVQQASMPCKEVLLVLKPISSKQFEALPKKFTSIHPPERRLTIQQWLTKTEQLDKQRLRAMRKQTEAAQEKQKNSLQPKFAK